MAKRTWLCRLGIHKDRRMHAVDGGGYFARCMRCGRDRDIPEIQVFGA